MKNIKFIASNFFFLYNKENIALSFFILHFTFHFCLYLLFIYLLYNYVKYLNLYILHILIFLSNYEFINAIYFVKKERNRRR